MILPGLKRLIGSSLLLDGAEGFVDRGAELPLDPFAAAQAVAVLAAEGALVLAHQRAGLFGDRAHLGRAVGAHVEDGPHVQRADRRVRVPGAAAAVLARTPAVSASVYSARCSSGTAQSSMKLTGLPSPLRLIMMLRPALRTSHRFFCGASSGISTTLPGRPSSPIRSTRSFSLRQQRCLVAARELDQQDGRGPADQRGLDGGPEGRVGEAQLDHRAVDQLDRGAAPSFTMCCAASIAAWKVGKLTMPSTLARGSSDSLSVRLRV